MVGGCLCGDISINLLQRFQSLAPLTDQPIFVATEGAVFVCDMLWDAIQGQAQKALVENVSL
jgi:hypothetical protein